MNILKRPVWHILPCILLSFSTSLQDKSGFMYQKQLNFARRAVILYLDYFVQMLTDFLRLHEHLEWFGENA